MGTSPHDPEGRSRPGSLQESEARQAAIEDARRDVDRRCQGTVLAFRCGSVSAMMKTPFVSSRQVHCIHNLVPLRVDGQSDLVAICERR